MTEHKFYDTRWFFGFMMTILFIVSYLFWGVLFIGPNKPQGRLERGLHNTIKASNQPGGSQRSMIPGMGGNRMNGGGQGGSARAFNPGGQQQG